MVNINKENAILTIIGLVIVTSGPFIKKEPVASIIRLGGTGAFILGILDIADIYSIGEFKRLIGL